MADVTNAEPSVETANPNRPQEPPAPSGTTDPSLGPEKELEAILEGVAPVVADQIQETLKRMVSEQLGIMDEEEKDESEIGHDELPNSEGQPIIGVFKSPYNFEAFHLGSLLEEIPVCQLKTAIPSKNEACRVVGVVVSWYNTVSREYLVQAQEIAQLRAENELLKEMRGRARQTFFDTSSERRSALERQDGGSGNGGNGSGNGGTGNGSGNGGNGSGNGGTGNGSGNGGTGNGSGNGGTGNGSGNDGTGNGSGNGGTGNGSGNGGTGNGSGNGGTGNGSGNGGTGNGSGDPSATGKLHPRRQTGCADKVTKDAIHVPVHKSFSQEALEELQKNGKLKKLSDGSYSMVVYITLPVVLDVSYERVQNTNTGEIFKSDSAEESKMLPRSLHTISLLTTFLYQRVALGIPVTRLLKQFNATGLKFTKQTFYGWFIQYAMALAQPMVKRMLEIILESGKAQTDETWTKIREDLKNEGRSNSILWLIRTSERLQIPPVVVVQYTGSRASKSFADMIRGYSLKLMSDGYSGYSALLRDFADKIELVGCLQHARSKFVDVIQALKGQNKYKKMSPEEKKALPVNKILDQFAKIFHLENEMDLNASYEERKKYRDEKVKVALDDLFKLIDEEYGKLLPNVKGYMRTAIEYARSFRQRFYDAVADPDMPIHNTGSERVFAAYSVLRSGYKQMDTVLGAESMCLWFSIFQTAKENGADEQMYIEFLLEELPSLLKEHGDFHFMSMRELKSLGLENMPKYGNLDYLDVLLPSGNKFKEFMEHYQQRKLSQVIHISEIIQNANLVA